MSSVALQLATAIGAAITARGITYPQPVDLVVSFSPHPTGRDQVASPYIRVVPYQAEWTLAARPSVLRGQVDILVFVSAVLDDYRDESEVDAWNRVTDEVRRAAATKFSMSHGHAVFVSTERDYLLEEDTLSQESRFLSVIGLRYDLTERDVAPSESGGQGPEPGPEPMSGESS